MHRLQWFGFDDGLHERRFNSFDTFAADGFPCVECGGAPVALALALCGHFGAAGYLLRLWDQMQRLSIKRGDKPIDGYRFAGLLETRDLRAANARATALQLHEPKVQDIGILFADAENDRVDNSGARRAGLAFKEGHAPLVRFAVRAQGFLAGSFVGANLVKGIQALASRYSLRGGGAAFAGECCLLAWGAVG